MNNLTFPLAQQAIRALIPHAGNMCLLYQVLSADDASISCTSISQVEAANPLRVGGKLSALCGIEYAAQAMAIHGGLTAQALNNENTPRLGYIVALSNVEVHIDALSDYALLHIFCERLMATESGSKYSFTISAVKSSALESSDDVLLEGSALVSLAPH